MRSSLLGLLGVASLSAPLAAADVITDHTYVDVADRYLQIQLLVLKRNELDDDPLADIRNTSDPMDFDGTDIDMDSGLGALIRAGTYVQGPFFDALELDAFGYGFDGFLSLIDTTENIDLVYTDQVTTSAAFNFSNSEAAERADFHYDSLFLSGALHAKHMYNEHLNVFVGPRFVLYQSDLLIRTDDDESDFSSAAQDRVDIKVDNHLIGLQGGVEFSRQVTDRIKLGFRGTGGIFLNHAEIDTHARELGGGSPNVKRSFSQDEFASILEAQSEFKFMFNDHFAFVSGGFLQWVNGIVESTNDITHFVLPSVDDIGTQDLLVYGGRIGFKGYF